MLTSHEKENELRQLADKRKQTRLKDYGILADYHDGKYECDYVSPWSKSAHNADAEIMIVGHDWSSEKWMSGPFDEQSAQRGYSDRFPTNRNLFDLLDRHFGLSFRDVYATNAFPFIKKGDSQGSIKSEDMRWAVREFLLHEIEIIRPVLVICLGVATFKAVRAVHAETQKLPKLEKISTLDQAIRAPYSKNPMVCAVAHTGIRTTIQRGRGQIDRDWKALRQRFDVLRTKC